MATWNIDTIKKKQLPKAIRCMASDGTMCDSKVELSMYETLKRMKVEFRFQVEIVLIGPAIHKAKPNEHHKLPLFKDRAAEAVKMTVDFVFERDGITYYCDTKGSKAYAKRDSKMRYDILKHKLFNEGRASVSRILYIEDKEVKRLSEYAAYQPHLFWTIFDQITER